MRSTKKKKSNAATPREGSRKKYDCGKGEAENLTESIQLKEEDSGVYDPLRNVLGDLAGRKVMRALGEEEGEKGGEVLNEVATKKKAPELTAKGEMSTSRRVGGELGCA